MAAATTQISVDYGTYKHFAYKEKKTTVELSWEPPADLEAKYVKTFNDNVIAGIGKLQDDLQKGAELAKKKLAEFDDKLDKLFSSFGKTNIASKEDIKFANEIQGILPNFIENLEKQRILIFESMLGKILAKVTSDLAAKLKKKISDSKIKKGLKIAAFAVLFLAATAVTIVLTIASFGLAAGPIIAAVGAGVSALGGLTGTIAKAKTIWASGKDEAKALETTAKAYASAAEDFEKVIARQKTQISAKRAQLDVLKKQIADAGKTIDKLDTLKKNLGGDMQAKIDKANAEKTNMEITLHKLEQDLEQQSKLVDEAQSKKSFSSALALAKLPADSKLLDQFSDAAGVIGSALGSVSGGLQRAGL